MTTFHSGNPTSISRLVLGIVFLGLLLPLVAMAGELNAPPAPTDAGSAMFSIEAIYQRLLNGAAGTKRGGTFSEPAGPPASTTPTLNDIMGVAPAVDPVNGARADQVVNGKTFWGLTSGEWGRRTGTMPVISPATIVPGAATQTIPAGYHDGTGKVGGDANLKSENIKAGTSIFGVSGNANVVDTSSGDATAAHIATGRKAWVAGAEITGNMPIVTPTTIVPGAATQTIPAGYHDGTGKVGGDANLKSENIKAGTSIFGVSGNANVVDTSSGDATAAHIATGKKAWVAGAEITGNMPVITPTTIVPGAATQTIPAGYHDGTGEVSGDANLKSENIKAGTTIFGVSGNPAVVDTSTGNATPGAILAGSQAWVNGVLVRGTRYAGVSCPDPDPARWSPNRRFYDNQDGTITDTTTGLIWLKYGSIGKFFYRASFPNYPAKVEVLKVYNGFYELTDGSIGGEWRLPSRRELDHLTHGVDAVRATSPQLFSSFPSGKIWTETIGTMNVELYVVDGTSGAFFLLEDNEQADVIPVRNPRP